MVAVTFAADPGVGGEDAVGLEVPHDGGYALQKLGVIVEAAVGEPEKAQVAHA